MAVKIVNENIVEMEVDAVVNAANEGLVGGGGVDGAIHKAAGPELDEACAQIGGCPTGEAVITWGYDMEYAIYIIHTVGPVWNGGNNGEEKLLRSAYQKSLELSKTHGCRSVAFPLISGGTYGYPKKEAIKIAIEEILKVQQENEKRDFYLTLIDEESFALAKELYPELI